MVHLRSSGGRRQCRAAGIGKQINTRTGRRAEAAATFSRMKSQFAACSGKTPVCLKFMGLTLKVR